MDEPLADVGICVVNYGSHEMLARNLDGVDGAVHATVVVDNLSTAAERRAVEAVGASRGWVTVAMDRNVGFGAAMNVAVATAARAGCTRFLLLNPDVRIEVDQLERLAAMAGKAPRTIVSPCLLRPDGSVWFTGGHLDLGRGLPLRSADATGAQRDRWLTGACLLVDRVLWDELGGFDPSFFLYWEDIDLSHRCLEAGGRLEVATQVVAIHDVGATQGAAGKSPVYCREMCKNRLRFASIHLPRRQRLRWIVWAPRYLVMVLTLAGRRDALRHPRRAAAALQGTLTGVGLVLRSVGRGASDRQRDGRR